MTTKHLRIMTLLAALLTQLAQPAQGSQEPRATSWQQLWQDVYPQAISLYDEGRFREAAALLAVSNQQLLAPIPYQLLNHKRRAAAVAALAMLGHLAYQNGEAASALFYYLRAQYLDPYHKPTQANLSTLQAQMGTDQLQWFPPHMSPLIHHPLWLTMLLIGSFSILIILCSLLSHFGQATTTRPARRRITIASALAIIVLGSGGISAVVAIRQPPPYDVVATATELFSTPGPARTSLWQLPPGTVILPDPAAASVTAPYAGKQATFVKVMIPTELLRTAAGDKAPQLTTKANMLPGWLPIATLSSYLLQQAPVEAALP